VPGLLGQSDEESHSSTILAPILAPSSALEERVTRSAETEALELRLLIVLAFHRGLRTHQPATARTQLIADATRALARTFVSGGLLLTCRA
jgi:hypothetical protein